MVVFITHQCMLLHNTYRTLYPYTNDDGETEEEREKEEKEEREEEEARYRENVKCDMNKVFDELIIAHNHRNVNCNIQYLRRFYQYAVRNQERIRKRRYHSIRVFLVFKKDPDMGYVNEVDDIEYYRLMFKSNREPKKVDENGEIVPVEKYYTERIYFRKVFHNKFTNNNKDIEKAYRLVRYEKYDETMYIAVMFNLSQVLEWTFLDEEQW